MTESQPCVVQVVWSLGYGGLERMVLDLAVGLRPLGWRVEVVALTNQVPLAEAFTAAGVPVQVEPQHGLDYRLPRRLARLFRRLGADLVHAHNYGRYLYAGPAARLARLPSLYTEHSNTRPAERALWHTQRLISRQAGGVVAVSETVRQGLVQQQGLPAELVRVIPNGVDLERFAGGDRARLRRELGVTSDDLVIGHVGRLVPVKNQRLLLAAFAQVVAEQPRSWLVLAGDGELRGELEQQAAALGIAPRVRFLGRRDDLPDILAGLDLFCLSSNSEGLPLAILEAMAAGRAVVATQAAGGDLVVPGQTGALTPTGDA
ncbi:MAG: glycosyltransferase, partial [Armatimonadetes bacterium]|nr:glycosyltransferase [Armatimonadota bacterium]